MQLRMLAAKVSIRFSISAILIFSILFGRHAYAQVSGATLSGTVTDSSGAAIPKAQVTITDVATGVARKIATDNAGLYTAPNLLPGEYQLSVTAPGFSTQQRTGITLT